MPSCRGRASGHGPCHPAKLRARYQVSPAALVSAGPRDTVHGVPEAVTLRSTVALGSAATHARSLCPGSPCGGPVVAKLTASLAPTGSLYASLNPARCTLSSVMKRASFPPGPSWRLEAWWWLLSCPRGRRGPGFPLRGHLPCSSLRTRCRTSSCSQII